jgi:hypothetical protein
MRRLDDGRKSPVALVARMAAMTILEIGAIVSYVLFGSWRLINITGLPTYVGKGCDFFRPCLEAKKFEYSNRVA